MNTVLSMYRKVSDVFVSIWIFWMRRLMDCPMEKEKIEDDLTYKIIGCAMKVHASLGNARLNGWAGLPGSDLPAGIGHRNEKSWFGLCQRTGNAYFL